MTSAEPRRTFHTFDGLRGVAAIAVVFRHLDVSWVSRMSPESYLAVDLFFILSGFVLAHAYAARLAQGMTVVEFFVARLIRLYPLYLLASVLTLLLVFVPATPGHYHPPAWSARDIVLALLFVPQIDPFHADTPIFALAGSAWSLAFELAANLVFAAVATRLTPRLLGLVVAGGAVVLIAAAWQFDSLDIGFNQTTAWGGIGRVGFGFFAGVAAYRLWQADTFAWLRLPTWAAVAVVVAIFHVEAEHHQAALDAALVILVMPALVLASARCEPGRWLARPCAILGAASYGVYILQNPIEQWSQTLVAWDGVRRAMGSEATGAVALVALTLAAALVLDRWYDLPVRAWLTRTWRNIRSRRAPVADSRIRSANGQR